MAENARPSKPLTDAQVRAWPPPADGRLSLMDPGERGLELRIHADGRRVFALRASVAGRDLRVTLGRYGPPPLLSLTEARIKARAIKSRFDAEGDFRSAERAAREAERARRAYTLDDLITEWEAHAAKRLRPSSLELYRFQINKHIRPALGARSLAEIARSDVRQLMTRIGENSCAPGRLHAAESARGLGRRVGALCVGQLSAKSVRLSGKTRTAGSI